MIADLPPALGHWASELDLFPHELAVAMTAITNPIDALIGPLRDRHRRGEYGEPDGYADIGRRGPYERLLLSEWLLATEEPDEWMRRAVSGEHSFLELSTRKPVAERLSIVLFDSGPSQWGSARLAHLAALIVLQRRAREAGARFGWGILQRPPSETGLWGEVNEASILRLTAGVAPREATPADVASWRDFVAGSRVDPKASSGFWFIGGQRLAPLAAAVNGSLLSIREPDEFDAAGDRVVSDDLMGRYLVANACFGPAIAPRTTAVDVRLPLPAPAECVRLLRDPFRARAHKPAVVEKKVAELPRDAPTSDFQFSLHGSKLYARAAAFGGTTLLIYPIGTSPAANVVSPPKQYRSQFGNPFFAVGRIGKATILATLTSDGSEVRIETINKTAGVVAGAYRLMSAEGQTTFASPHVRETTVDRTRLMPILPSFVKNAHLQIDELVTALPDGRLLRLRWNVEKNEGEGLVTNPQVLALHRGNLGVLMATSANQGVDRYVFQDKPDSKGDKLVFHDSLTMASHLSQVTAGTAGDHQPIAFQDGLEFGDPVVASHSRDPTKVAVACVDQFVVDIPSGQQVVGVARNSSGDPVRRAALILLAPDRTTVSALPIDEPEQITLLFRTTGAKITQIAKSPYAPLIAFATADGEVAVWSLKYKDYVYRRLANASDSADNEGDRGW